METSNRWAAVLGTAVGAPICAEYLQAYLDVTGDPAGLAFGVAFLAPLYGGAALIIREIAVRTGRGWPGILLLAAAFGVAMPGLVDLSLWTEHAPDVTDWQSLWAPTAAFGMSWHAGVAWSLGHVVMSIGVPLALLNALAPSLQGRTLLGRPGIVLAAAMCLAVAAVIHLDAGPGSAPTGKQMMGVVVVVLGLIALSLTRVGRPVRRTTDRRAWRLAWAFALGFAAMVTIDFAPPTWAGLIILTALVTGLAVVLVRASRSTSWALPHSTAVGCGALLERALVGFAAPTPPGVELSAKVIQCVVLLVAVLVVISISIQRSRTQPVAAPA